MAAPAAKRQPKEFDCDTSRCGKPRKLNRRGVRHNKRYNLYKWAGQRAHRSCGAPRGAQERRTLSTVWNESKNVS